MEGFSILFCFASVSYAERGLRSEFYEEWECLKEPLWRMRKKVDKGNGRELLVILRA